MTKIIVAFRNLANVPNKTVIVQKDVGFTIRPLGG
jgi:hypothetical protein